MQSSLMLLYNTLRMALMLSWLKGEAGVGAIVRVLAEHVCADLR